MIAAGLRQRCAALRQKLRRNTSGVAMVEFALILPVLTTLGMFGTETAYLAIINMRISQLALEVGDNAARMEQTSNSAVAPTVTEADINSVFTGVAKEGAYFNFTAQGKVIVSSLEKDPTSGKQFIHWQRCTGSLAKSSAYGTVTATQTVVPANSTLTGMGSGATKVTAPAGAAVMFVEVYYTYKGLFGTMFVPSTVMKQEAAFIMRDARDLKQSPFVSDPLSGTTTAGCS